MWTRVKRLSRKLTCQPLRKRWLNWWLRKKRLSDKTLPRRMLWRCSVTVEKLINASWFPNWKTATSQLIRRVHLPTCAVALTWWPQRLSKLSSWLPLPVLIGVDRRTVRWWPVSMVSPSRRRRCWMSILFCWKKPRSVTTAKSVRRWTCSCSPTL